jgi:hypothetical protein
MLNAGIPAVVGYPAVVGVFAVAGFPAANITFSTNSSVLCCSIILSLGFLLT